MDFSNLMVRLTEWFYVLKVNGKKTGIRKLSNPRVIELQSKKEWFSF